jgi:DNA-binding transcriptional LysR family regulator
VKLTPAGEAFLDEARALLVQAERAPIRARRIGDGDVGQLNLGFIPASGYWLLGDVIKRTRSRLKGVRLDLFEMDTPTQIAQLRLGAIDVGLGRMNQRIEGIETQLIHAEDLILAMPSDDPFAEPGRPLTRADVASRPLLMHNRRGARYFHELILKHFELDPSKLVYSLAHSMTMVNLVSSGLGVALVPESTRALGIDGVTFRSIDDLPQKIVHTHAIWKWGTTPVVSRWLNEIL